MNQPSPMQITPGTTPGATPAGSTPNGGQRAKVRKPQKAADPFMRRKPVVRRREPSPESQARKEKPHHEKDKFFSVQAGAINSALVAVNTAMSIVDSSSGITKSGFDTAAPGNYVDYPVIITKGQLKEKLRHHAARFYGRQEVDPMNSKEWTRPVRLYRRDGRTQAPGSKPEEPDPKELEMMEEREKQQLLREQRNAQRMAEMAEIAPSLSTQPAKKFGKDQKKLIEVRRKDETEAKRAASQLSYEEALPWHFEDDEGKQIWIGTYEAALSEAYAQFTIRGNKVYLTPLEKWYKFTQQRVFASEEELAAKIVERKDPKFLRDYAEKQQAIKEEKAQKAATSGLWQVGGVRTANFKTGNTIKVDRDDAEELDFDEDVADDDEDAVYEGDGEEMKETQRRIKKDQLKANIFNMKDEGSYDEEDEEETLAREARKLLGKATSKLLIRQENNRLYASDSDISESDEPKDLDVKKEANDKAEAEKQKLASGISSKGTNTPSGRKEKHRGIRSQDQSEASGNESSRKHLKKNGLSSKLASGRNTPNGATPRSLSPGPSNGTLKPPLLKANSALKRPRPPGAGSGSDGEGAGSGAEMSDGSRKRIKLKSGAAGSKGVTPNRSRATSPNRDPASEAPKIPPPLPSRGEVNAMIPATGMLMKEFVDFWSDQMKSANKKAFMGMMKGTVKIDERDGVKWVLPGAMKPSSGS